MSEDKNSILLSDVTVNGDIIEKEKVIIDAKITGDVTAEEIETHQSSEIKGNINGKVVTINGKVIGNIHSDRINIKSDADVDGVLNQKTLSIQEGAKLKIKTETHK